MAVIIQLNTEFILLLNYLQNFFAINLYELIGAIITCTFFDIPIDQFAKTSLIKAFLNSCKGTGYYFCF